MKSVLIIFLIISTILSNIFQLSTANNNNPSGMSKIKKKQEAVFYSSMFRLGNLERTNPLF